MLCKYTGDVMPIPVVEVIGVCCFSGRGVRLDFPLGRRSGDSEEVTRLLGRRTEDDGFVRNASLISDEEGVVVRFL